MLDHIEDGRVDEKQVPSFADKLFFRKNELPFKQFRVFPDISVLIPSRHSLDYVQSCQDRGIPLRTGMSIHVIREGRIDRPSIRLPATTGNPRCGRRMHTCLP